MPLSPWIILICADYQKSSLRKNLSPWKVWLGKWWKTLFLNTAYWSLTLSLFGHWQESQVSKCQIYNRRKKKKKKTPWMKVKEMVIRFAELELGALQVLFHLLLWGRYYYPTIPKGRNWVWEVKVFALFGPYSTVIIRNGTVIQRIWFCPILISLLRYLKESEVKLSDRGITRSSVRSH